MNKKRQAFVVEYLKDFNATKAAERVGYKKPKQQGSRLLTFVDVSEEVQRQLDERAMSADEDLDRLAQMARADIADFLTDGKIDLSVAAGKTHLIKKYKVTSTRYGPTTEIELHDSQHALELIGKHHKLFTEKVEVDGPINLIVNTSNNDNPFRSEPRQSEELHSKAAGSQ